jgi:hypothetical protein
MLLLLLIAPYAFSATLQVLLKLLLLLLPRLPPLSLLLKKFFLLLLLLLNSFPIHRKNEIRTCPMKMKHKLNSMEVDE